MSQYIPQEMIDSIRQESNIVQVVGEYVQLKKSGKNFLGLCPFHNEKSPSFTVSEDKQIFHCFGCGKGGNVFTFIQEIEGVDFPQSVQKLAAPLNIDVPLNSVTSNHSQQLEHHALIEAHEKAKEFYHHILLNTQIGSQALDYLMSRGLDLETIKHFEIGFAPYNRTILSKVLIQESISESVLNDTGLFVVRDDGTRLDRFFQRIMFPIKNDKGQTIGFSGRLLPDQTLDLSTQAKYLNSPETLLFNKRDVIYNFDKARPHIRKSNEVYLYEGFMDVIASVISGVDNAIATMGTSLTTQQIHQLERVCQNVVIAYDGDDAGQKATEKAIELFQENSMLSLQIVMFPAKKDPDEYRMEFGAEALKQELLSRKQTIFQFKKIMLKKRFNLENESDRLTYIDSLLEELSDISSVIEKDMVLSQLVTEFSVSKAVLQNQLDAIQSRKKKQVYQAHHNNHVIQPHDIEFEKNVSQAEKAERLLIYRLMMNRSVYQMMQMYADLSFLDDQYQQLYQHLMHFYEINGTVELAQFLDYLKEDYLKQLLTSISVERFNEFDSESEITDCITVIQREHLKNEIQKLKNVQQEAKMTGDTTLEIEATLNIVEKQKQLANI